MAFTYLTKQLLRAIKPSPRYLSTLPGPPYSTLFFGSDKFSLAHLDALRSHWAESKPGTVVRDLHVVVTSEHLCTLIQSPVARYARKNKLNIIPWKTLLTSPVMPYDMGVVVSFGHMIPKQMIDMFPCGVVNVHPSDLPKYRGATPIQHTILHGDRATAVCVMKIQPFNFDEGPIYKREAASVGEDEALPELRERLADIGSRLLLETMSDFPDMTPVEQQGKPTFAPKLTHRHSMVNWHNQTKNSIYRQHLALSANYALTTPWQEFLIRFPEMLKPGSFKEDDLPQANPGTVELLPSGNLAVRCKDGWVAFKLVIHKKKRLSAKDFYHGHLQSQSVEFESIDNKLAVLR